MDCVPFLPKEVALGKTRSFPQNCPESARLAVPMKHCQRGMLSSPACRALPAETANQSGWRCPGRDVLRLTSDFLSWGARPS
jgi:hypothetical protein